MIYLGLAAYVIFQALPAQHENPRLRAVSGWFMLSSVANIAWIFLWHCGQFSLTIVAMLALLASLLVIYLRLRSGNPTVTPAERWAVRIPFSIYLGWVSVATIANASQVLFYAGWDGLGIAPAVWAAIMLGVATILGLLMALNRRDAAYLLVFVWAFVGIALKHQTPPLVSVAAWIATALVTLLVVWSVFAGKTPKRASALRAA